MLSHQNKSNSMLTKKIKYWHQVQNVKIQKNKQYNPFIYFTINRHYLRLFYGLLNREDRKDPVYLVTVSPIFIHLFYSIYSSYIHIVPLIGSTFRISYTTLKIEVL